MTISELRGADLFDAVVAHIETHPEQWNQRTYGKREDGVMTGCFAFLTVLLADGPDVFMWSDEDDIDIVVLDGAADEHAEQCEDVDDATCEHRTYMVAHRAQFLLDISFAQTLGPYYGLFCANTTLDEIRRYGSNIYGSGQDGGQDSNEGK